MTKHAVTRILLPDSSDSWMFKRDCFVFSSESEARAKATSCIKVLEHEGYFHYRNYKDQDVPPQRKLDLFTRSRWGLKKNITEDDKPCIDIRIIPIEQCFDPCRNEWVDPRWMLYNHVDEDYRLVLDDIDAKLIVAASAMQHSDLSEFKVLDMKWSEQVNLAFKCIEKNDKGLVCNDEVVLSLFPLQ